MTKYIIIILFLLTSGPARAAGLEDTLAACSKSDSHAEMRECLEKNAAASETALHAAESALLSHISKRDEERDFITAMKNTLSAGNKDFQTYRESECAFYASIAAGGNGADDLRLACIAALNTTRAEQLQWPQAQGEQASQANNTRSIEESIMIDIVEDGCLTEHFGITKYCRVNPPNVGGGELAIAALGERENDSTTDALIDLIGVRLDGAGAEERELQICLRGSALQRRLKHIEASQIAEHCRSAFFELRKHVLANVSGARVEDVCFTEHEIQGDKDQWLADVLSKETCEP